MLFGPMALAAVWAIDDPAAAIGVVPAEFQGAADPGGGSRSLSGGEEAALSSEIFTNNIRVTFLAIAGGILGGLGTAAVTIFNGGFIGAIIGLTIENGSSSELLRFILPTACSSSPASRSPRAPGCASAGRSSIRGRSRAASRCGGRRGRRWSSCSGTMPWLVLAGLVEGFVSGDLGLAAATVVGAGLGILYWGLVAWRGGSEPRAGLRARGRRGRRRRAARPRAPRGRSRRRAPARGDAVAGGEDVERDGRAVDVARRAGRGGEQRVEVGVDAPATTTSWRRASTGTASTSDRAAASSIRSVKTTIERALGAGDGLEGELVVGVDGRAARGRRRRARARRRPRAAAAGGAGRASSNATTPQRSPSSSATSADGGRRVDARRRAACASPQRRGHQAAAVEHAA